MLNKIVYEYEINGQTGFYNICKAAFGDSINEDFCEKSWFRIAVPEWLKKYWHPVEVAFIGGRTAMFRFCSGLLHDTEGQYIFLSRNLLNRVGCMKMYEYYIQSENNDPRFLVKICKCDSPPSSFQPTLDPPCDYNITECAAAKADCNDCAIRWMLNNRQKMAAKRQAAN